MRVHKQACPQICHMSCSRVSNSCKLKARSPEHMSSAVSGNFACLWKPSLSEHQAELLVSGFQLFQARLLLALEPRQLSAPSAVLLRRTAGEDPIQQQSCPQAAVAETWRRDLCPEGWKNETDLISKVCILSSQKLDFPLQRRNGSLMGILLQSKQGLGQCEAANTVSLENPGSMAAAGCWDIC